MQVAPNTVYFEYVSPACHRRLAWPRRLARRRSATEEATRASQVRIVAWLNAKPRARNNSARLRKPGR